MLRRGDSFRFVQGGKLNWVHGQSSDIAGLAINPVRVYWTEHHGHLIKITFHRFCAALRVGHSLGVLASLIS
jgi:hypothetical protein